MANDPRFEVYPRQRVQTEKGEMAPNEFGWRFRAANGQITAIGGEGFTREEDAERACEVFIETIDIGVTNHAVPPILRVED